LVHAHHFHGTLRLRNKAAISLILVYISIFLTNFSARSS
jgi:hypothetical protein